jgi:hypothetical protein
MKTIKSWCLLKFELSIKIPWSDYECFSAFNYLKTKFRASKIKFLGKWSLQTLLKFLLQIPICSSRHKSISESIRKKISFSGKLFVTRKDSLPEWFVTQDECFIRSDVFGSLDPGKMMKSDKFIIIKMSCHCVMTWQALKSKTRILSSWPTSPEESKQKWCNYLEVHPVLLILNCAWESGGSRHDFLLRFGNYSYRSFFRKQFPSIGYYYHILLLAQLYFSVHLSFLSVFAWKIVTPNRLEP